MRLLLYEVSFRLYSCTNDYVDNLLIGSRNRTIRSCMRVYNAAEPAHYCGGAGAGRERPNFLPTHKVRRSSAIYNRQCTIKLFRA